LWIVAPLSFIWWPLSHWVYPTWYHDILGFSTYDPGAVKIIGTLSLIPILMMIFAAKNPIKNKDILLILVISGFLISVTYLYLILANQFPLGEYFNVILTFSLSLILLIIYPWKFKYNSKK
jgi:hypothetical protein